MAASEVAIIAGCGALLAFGAFLTVRWFGTAMAAPPLVEDPRAHIIALRTLWWFGLVTAVGATTGLLIIGAGGRLAMRLLAVTAGDDAQGALTEAEQIVGDITIEGTFGFFVFGGLLGGGFSALLFVAIQRWLPPAPWNGFAFGALLLVVVTTRVEPLRPDNEDFDLVGPAWLSLVVFGVLAMLQGIAIASFAGRWSGSQPLLTTFRTIPRYLPLVPYLLLGPTILLMAVVAIAAIILARITAGRPARRRAFDVAGYAVLGFIVVVSLPGFVAALNDIAQRG